MQLSFYGAYHSKAGNKAIHFVFVPPIVWAFMVLFAYSGALFGVDMPAHAAHFLPPWIAQCAAPAMRCWQALRGCPGGAVCHVHMWSLFAAPVLAVHLSPVRSWRVLLV